MRALDRQGIGGTPPQTAPKIGAYFSGPIPSRPRTLQCTAVTRAWREPGDWSARWAVEIGLAGEGTRTTGVTVLGTNGKASCA